MDMQELKQLIYKGEKVDVECKKAQNSVPDSVYETYSSFANTKGGTIVLGVDEDKTKTNPKQRFIVRGINNPEKLREDFWNTINTVMDQVTLILEYQADGSDGDVFVDTKMSEDDVEKEQNERRLSEEYTEQEQNERRLSEVLKASDYKKVEKIILFLEENRYITPQIAEELIGKSASTVRRYLRMLVGTGYVKVDGSTSNIKYMI